METTNLTPSQKGKWIAMENPAASTSRNTTMYTKETATLKPGTITSLLLITPTCQPYLIKAKANALQVKLLGKFSLPISCIEQSSQVTHDKSLQYQLLA